MNSTSFTHAGDIEISDDNKIFVDLAGVDTSRKPVKRIELICDTGAFITIIGKERAEASGYPIIESKGCIISGFSEKGLICDLRKISCAIFCGFEIKDVIIATPHENGVRISEVLGMNVLENFNFGFNLTEKKIYLNKRESFESFKPKYKCGEINIFIEGE